MWFNGFSAGLRTKGVLIWFPCLGCGPGTQLGVCEKQPTNVSLSHQRFSPSLSPALPLSLKRNKQTNKEWKGAYRERNLDRSSETWICILKLEFFPLPTDPWMAVLTSQPQVRPWLSPQHGRTLVQCNSPLTVGWYFSQLSHHACVFCSRQMLRFSTWAKS